MDAFRSGHFKSLLPAKGKRAQAQVELEGAETILTFLCTETK